MDEEEDDVVKEPKPFLFGDEPPPMSVQTLDILKLTALYVAKNGNQFLQELMQVWCCFVCVCACERVSDGESERWGGGRTQTHIHSRTHTRSHTRTHTHTHAQTHVLKHSHTPL